MISLLGHPFETEPPFTAGYDLPLTSIQLSSNLARQIEVVESYLAPYRGSSPPAPGSSFSVRTLHGDALALSILALVPQLPPGRVVAHHPDTAYVVRYEDGEYRLLEAIRGVPHALLARSDRAYAILTDGREGIEVLKPALRILRELFVRTAENRDGIVLHASAAAVNGHGFVFVGPSGAGKTTLAIAMARQVGGVFLSSDRVIVRRTGASHRALTWLAGINVGIGTCRATGRSIDYWRSAVPRTLNTYFTLARDRGFEDDDKYCLTPSELAELFQLSCGAEAPLCRIVFPQLLDEDAVPVRVERLPPASVTAGLMEQLRTGCDEVYFPGVVAIGEEMPDSTGERARAAIADLTKSVPGVALSVSKSHMARLLTRDVSLGDCLSW